MRACTPLLCKLLGLKDRETFVLSIRLALSGESLMMEVGPQTQVCALERARPYDIPRDTQAILRLLMDIQHISVEDHVQALMSTSGYGPGETGWAQLQSMGCSAETGNYGLWGLLHQLGKAMNSSLLDLTKPV